LKYTQRSHLYFFDKFDKPIDIISWVNKRWVEQIKSSYCNKLFMPAFCAKNFIEITGVRCERLQNISDEDCLKEGIEEQRWTDCPYNTFCVIPDTTCELCNAPQEAYAALIDSINGRGAWESNPFVFCYSFKLIK
jgi:hypothetical protein